MWALLLFAAATAAPANSGLIGSIGSGGPVPVKERRWSGAGCPTPGLPDPARIQPETTAPAMISMIRGGAGALVAGVARGEPGAEWRRCQLVLMVDARLFEPLPTLEGVKPAGGWTGPPARPGRIEALERPSREPVERHVLLEVEPRALPALSARPEVAWLEPLGCVPQQVESFDGWHCYDLPVRPPTPSRERMQVRVARGSLSDAALRVARSHQRELEVCTAKYEAGPGPLALEITVEQGEVVQVQPGRMDAILGSCLATRVQRWRFPVEESGRMRLLLELSPMETAASSGIPGGSGDSSWLPVSDVLDPRRQAPDCPPPRIPSAEGLDIRRVAPRLSLLFGLKPHELVRMIASGAPEVEWEGCTVMIRAAATVNAPLPPIDGVEETWAGGEIRYLRLRLDALVPLSQRPELLYLSPP